ncbi:MAG TPA: NADPH:quinone oxidoreductase [Porticoccaceae bacterium]|nr:NADPH:quinone oxidoreductase [Porticoccaceae bacterium]
MKALVCEQYGPVEDLKYRDFPDPEPAPGEILVAVKAIGVNFPDGLLVEGKYQARPECPFAPGSEISGEVVGLGEGVIDFAVGDRVLALTTNFGAYAEQITLPSLAAYKMPASMDYETGAALLAASGTAHHGLRQRGRLQAGETLVVLGAAGGTGIAAVQIGKAMGARVIAVCSSEEKLAFAKSQGADDGINYSEQDLNKAIKALTNGRGADVVYDAVGGDAFDACSRAMAWDGRLLIVGFASGRIPTLPVNLTLVKGYSVVGVFWGQFTQTEPEAHAANMRELFQWCEAGKVKPIVDRTYKLADGIDAIKYVTGRNVMGKVVITP